METARSFLANFVAQSVHLGSTKVRSEADECRNMIDSRVKRYVRFSVDRILDVIGQWELVSVSADELCRSACTQNVSPPSDFERDTCSNDSLIVHIIRRRQSPAFSSSLRNLHYGSNSNKICSTKSHFVKMWASHGGKAFDRYFVS